MTVQFKETLVVNLIGAPGAGKSTTAAYVFSQLKWKGVETEIVTEFYKDLVWEQAGKAFDNQIYTFGNHFFRISRLIGEVEVIVVDSPIMLVPVYSENEELCKLAYTEHRKMNNFNFYVKRKIPYSEIGRLHTEEEASAIDKKILSMLYDYKLGAITVDGTQEGGARVVEFVMHKIGMVK